MHAVDPSPPLHPEMGSSPERRPTSGSQTFRAALQTETGWAGPAPITLGPADGSSPRANGAQATDRWRGASRWARRVPMAFAAIAAVAFCVMTNVGASHRVAHPITDGLDRLTALAGWPLAEVRIAGLAASDLTQLTTAIHADAPRSLVGVRAHAIRARLVALDWIAEADIRRIWPDRLDVVIREHTPYALKVIERDDLVGVLIGADGTVLEMVDRSDHLHLPRVTGAGGDTRLAAIRDVVERHPDVAARVEIYEFVGRRRWRLHLHAGRVLDLPEVAPEVALARFVDSIGMAEAQPDRVYDLRTPGRISIRPPDTRARRSATLPSRAAGRT